MLRSKCQGNRGKKGPWSSLDSLRAPGAHLTACLANLVNSRPSHRLYFKTRWTAPAGGHQMHVLHRYMCTCTKT